MWFLAFLGVLEVSFVHLCSSFNRQRNVYFMIIKNKCELIHSVHIFVGNNLDKDFVPAIVG